MALSKVDLRYLRLCYEAAQESHDPSRQVGAVIVGGRDRFVVTGTNRPPQLTGLTHDESFATAALNPDWKYFVFEHAERDAIYRALRQGLQLDDSTMYVSLFPCADCARAIVASGIKRVVAPNPTIGSQADEKWASHFAYAHELFERSRTQLELLDADDLKEVHGTADGAPLAAAPK